MPTFTITGDDPERARKVALRRLARESQDFTSLTIDAGGITVVTDRVPDMPPAFTIEEVPDEPTVEIGGQTMTQAQFDAARLPLIDPSVPDIVVEDAIKE